MNSSFKEKWAILVIISAILAVSFSHGCLIGDPVEWYSPAIHASFDAIDLESLADTLYENNISSSFERPYFLSLYLPEDKSYVFSNTTYNISATSIRFLNNSRPPYVRLRLADWQYEKYRFSSKDEALEASYLPDPSFELMNYFLNESGNQPPRYVEYRA